MHNLFATRKRALHHAPRRARKYLRLPLVLFVACLAGALPGFLGASAPARAQESRQDYRLAADDVISILVQRHPELSAREVTIGPSGSIDLPEAGRVRIAGKTTGEVARDITKRLSVTLVRPNVTVSLDRPRVTRISVLGTAVARPGQYDIKPGWRVAQALAAAGGLAARVSEISATLSRAGQPVAAVDVRSVLDNPATSRDNRVLRPNDVLVVTALEPRRVTVSGDVVKPDVYELRRAPRLLDAVNAAGGLKQRTSASRAWILRGGKRIDLDLSSAIEFRSPEANIALKPNDLLSVESIPALRVSVDGLVRNPGNFQLDAGSGVIQAVAQAGGVTVPADQVVSVVRRGQQVLPIDLRKAAFEPGADIPLQEGDIVLLAEPDVIRVQVTGVVQRPGALRLPLQSRVLDAIARAGGLTPSPAAARIDILRELPDGRQVSLSVDPVALTTLSDARQNLLLRDGDTISVSALQSRIAFVSGQVARPGAYEISANDGVAEIIARAGGAADAAALKRVTLQREGKSQIVDVRAALTRGGETAGPPLQAGDFVVVPRNTQRVLVLQAVQRPGEVLLPEEGTLTIGEAVSLAGGPRDRAVIREVALFRRFPQGLQRRIIQLDKVYDPKTAKDMGNAKGTVQTGFNLGLNEVLRDGDIVYVPEGKPSRSAYDSISRAVGTLTSLRFLGVF